MSLFVTSKVIDTAHGFFGRSGGVSQGLYQSLNCGLGSKDERQALLANFEIIKQSLGAPSARLVTLPQIHSAKVIEISSHDHQPTEADGMVTKERGIILGILTADCAPVLFYDKHNQIIGACHAGWKGAFTGILEQTIAKMIELGAKTSLIQAAIGPTIAQPSYEVDSLFYKNFIDQDPSNSLFFSQGRDLNKYQFNLEAYIIKRLGRLALKNIEPLGIDTYNNQDCYFSYRRSYHRSEIDYGRQISCITLNRQ